jgi:hypothetical protein
MTGTVYCNSCGSSLRGHASAGTAGLRAGTIQKDLRLNRGRPQRRQLLRSNLRQAVPHHRRPHHRHGPKPHLAIRQRTFAHAHARIPTSAYENSPPCVSVPGAHLAWVIGHDERGQGLRSPEIASLDARARRIGSFTGRRSHDGVTRRETHARSSTLRGPPAIAPRSSSFRLRPTGSATRDAAKPPNQRRSTTHTNRREVGMLL